MDGQIDGSGLMNRMKDSRLVEEAPAEIEPSGPGLRIPETSVGETAVGAETVRGGGRDQQVGQDKDDHRVEIAREDLEAEIAPGTLLVRIGGEETAGTTKGNRDSRPHLHGGVEKGTCRT